MVQKAYVNNAPDMRHAQMNDALVKALDPQLAQIALKEISNRKSTASEPQLTFAQLVEKIHQDDITRTHIDRHKINTYSTLSSFINNLSLDIDNLTVDDIHTKRNHAASNFVKNTHDQNTVFPLALKKLSQNHLKSLSETNFQSSDEREPNSSKQTSHIKQYDWYTFNITL